MGCDTPEKMDKGKQYFHILVLGQVEDGIVECFRNGGGVPYERYPRLHEIMVEDSGQPVLSSLGSHTVPLVPELNAQLAGAIRVLNVGWRRGRIMK